MAILELMVVRVIAVLQIFGGVQGLVLLLPRLAGGVASRSLPALVFVLAICALAVVGGVLVLEHNPKATRLLIVALAAQVPMLAFGSFVYHLSLGASALASVGAGGHPAFSAGFGSAFLVSLHGESFRVGINLMPLLFLALLRLIRRI